ncbi:MAG: DNA mismatch repair endonuclease MutL [Aerococcaceae bacterium]|nr:DNA mismatch repair endonuclease MutL [Aerococcaceae bacterium]
MGKIRQMSEALANQIAAGEVVERPASVVKELVENAIDASSTEITIELIEAGIQRIRIIDNGEGMDADDLQLAFVPHATSKIYQLSDLFQIHSLGFRGEALASIGSVAKVRVDSAQENAAGNYLVVEGSKIIEQGASNARKGTTITVDSLFYNTPARLKHLSSLKTELKHILNFVQDIALSYPEIRFTLLSEGEKIFHSYGTGQLRQTIANIYQPSVARQLIELSAQDEDFSVSGFISPPQLTRTSKYYLHWIINGRAIRSYALNDILIRAYGKQLMIGRYPLAVIRIDLDPRLVDVNVHPTKQTVRLSKEKELADLLTQAIQQALGTINPIPEVEVEALLQPKTFKRTLEETLKTEAMPLDFSQPYQNTSSEESATILVEESVTNLLTDASEETLTELATETLTEVATETVIEPPSEREVDTSTELLTEPFVGKSTEPPTAQLIDTSNFTEPISTLTSEQLRPALDFASLRYVGQIHGTYLIAESESGFYLIDQHAAQERLRYEQFMQADFDVSQQQSLLLPYIFHFTQAEMRDVEQVLPQLKALGIHLEHFGPTSYQLDAYPMWLDADEVETLVKDLTEWLVENPNIAIADIKEQSIIMQSCRGAIKANHYLDAKQANALIQAMATLEDPYHCPHGRPVFVEFNQKTLEKLFKRIQDPHERNVLR